MKFDAFTMGFSNRSWEQTIQILQAFHVRRLVDIRTLPGSKHTPQFNLEHMSHALPDAGIEYLHMKSLGGLRKPLKLRRGGTGQVSGGREAAYRTELAGGPDANKDSTLNAAWKNSGFRGYADYMQTPDFEAALGELIRLVTERVTVYCCTEAVFWRCHRQLVSDALTVRGYSIGHIFNASKVEQHKLTNFVRVDGIRLTYPTLI